jgi:diguanylate cyclase (GGDEF)-like protein
MRERGQVSTLDPPAHAAHTGRVYLHRSANRAARIALGVAAAAFCAVSLPAQAGCLGADGGKYRELEELAFREPSAAMPRLTHAIAVLRRAPATPALGLELAQVNAIAADASRQLGLSRQAINYADAGLSAMPVNDNSDLAIRMRTVRALVSTNVGGIDAAITELTRIADSVVTRPLALGCTLRDRGWLHFREGNTDQALHDLTRAHDLLRSHATAEEHMVAVGRLSMAHYAAKDYAAALALVDQSIEFFRRAKAQVRLATALDRRASILKSAGRLDEALTASNEALQVHTNVRDLVGTGLSEMRLCSVEIERQEFVRARQWCDRAQATLARTAGMDDNDYRTLAALRGRLALAQDRAREAIAQFDIAIAPGGAMPADDIAALYDLRSRAHAAVGDYALAFRDQGEYLRRVREQGELDRIREVANLRVQFDIDRERQKTALLEADKRHAEEGLRSQERFTIAATLASIAALLTAAMLGYALWSNRRYRTELTALAERDELTGLPNRRKILASASQMLASALEREQVGAIALIDLDLFKHINDHFGHDAGDAVLREFGTLARATLRGDDQVGRYGGEEFLLLLPDTEIDDAVAVLERLRTAVHGIAIPGANGAARVSMSCGVTAISRQDRTLDQIVRRADVALYAAKSGGRDRIEQYVPTAAVANDPDATGRLSA